MQKNKTWLLLGSNIEPRKEYLLEAQKRITFLAGNIISVSSIYESPPWGFHATTNFYNQALCLETQFSPFELLETIQNIEKQMGRSKNALKYESRTIDIDILLFDDFMLITPQLTIPHPHLHQRRFALLPLAEIAADIIISGTQQSVAQMLIECPDNSTVTRIFD